MRFLDVKIKKLHPDTKIPVYSSEEAAGCDLHSLYNTVIIPKEVTTLRTGVAMEIPYGWEAQARPRSGLSCNHLLILPNSPGTIDSDYRGEITVNLYNLGSETYEVQKGDRICQLIFQEVTRGIFKVVDGLSETKRGKGGYGSTGK